MVQGIIIPANNTAPLPAARLDSLEDYQRVVGWIEAIDIPDLGVTMYVNEDGLIHVLPFIRRATFLWWFYIPAVRRAARILGDVVLVGLPDNAREATDLPADLRPLLLETGATASAHCERGQSRWHKEPTERDDYVETIVWATLLLEMLPRLEVRIDPGKNAWDGSNQP